MTSPSNMRYIVTIGNNLRPEKTLLYTFDSYDDAIAKYDKLDPRNEWLTYSKVYFDIYKGEKVLGTETWETGIMLIEHDNNGDPMPDGKHRTVAYKSYCSDDYLKDRNESWFYYLISSKDKQNTEES